LLVGCQSPHWPPSRTRCSFVLIHRDGLLVRVTRLPSFSLLANISYRFLVGSHSPRWPPAPTHCSFDLVFADLHLDVWQKRRILHLWPTSRMCCSFVLIRRAGPLVRIARLPSFSLLAYISYAFRVCSHFPLPTARTHCSSALIRLVGQHIVPVARRPSYSTLASCSYAFSVCSHHPLPTSRMHCSSALILLATLHLVRVARLPLFSSLVYILYALLVFPYAPPYVAHRS